MPDFGSWATAWWKPVLFVIVAGHLTNVSVTLFLHRAQTHRGVKLLRLFRFRRQQLVQTAVDNLLVGLKSGFDAHGPPTHTRG